MNKLIYIDFHAHHEAVDDETFVIQDGVQTRGRHPWHLTSPHAPLGGLRNKGEQELSPVAPQLAIGESGLDKACDTPYELQLQVFREEVALSEEVRKPLFLHCVRAIDDVLRIRRELRARQPIIWHGYRGHAQQLRQLLQQGFYFSFGFRYNPEALRACPPDRLLLESDEDTRPVSLLYNEVALQLNMPVENLIRQMHCNFQALFGELN